MREIAAVAILLASVGVLPGLGQASPQNTSRRASLSLEAVRALVENQTPDIVIAGEITSRDLGSAPNDDWIADLVTRGAGPRTISALRALVPLGALTVNTSITECQIFLDGRSTGTTGNATSLRVPNLRFGTHSLSIRKDRYLNSDQIIMIAVAEVSVSIRPVSAVGSLTLTTDAPGALISIAGFPTYTGQVDGLDLSQGNYSASVSAPGHKPSEVSFAIAGGRVTTMTVHLEPVVSMLIDAMNGAVSKKDYTLAAREARELLTIAPNNGLAYLTLAQVAFYAGNVAGFFENTRSAIQNNIQVPFSMIHINEKTGTHPVVVRLGLGSIRFDKGGSGQCSLPDFAIMPSGGLGPSQPTKGRKLKSQVQGARVTADKSGRPVLELTVLGHAAQFVDAVTNRSEAVPSRDEYEVIQSVLQGTNLDPRLAAKNGGRPVGSSAESIPTVAARSPKPEVRVVPLLERALKAMGGLDALLALRDSSSVAQGTLYPGGIPIHTSMRFIAPHYIRQDSELPSGKSAVYTDGTSGWASTSSGVSTLSTKQINDIVLYSDVVLAAKLDLSLAITTIADDTIQVITGDVQTITIQCDRNTGLPRVITHPYSRSGVSLSAATILSDWRDVNGFKVAFKRVTEVGGEKIREDTVLDVRVNSGLTVIELSRKP